MLPRSARLARFLAHAGVFATLLLLTACEGEHPQTTFRPVTDFGADINALFANTTWWTMAILAVVEIALLVTILRFRYNADRKPSQTHGNTLVEIIWTVIPAVIVVAIVIPTVGMIWKTQADEPEGALVVEAVGHQWWWEFRIPEYGVVAANQVHLPTGRPIRVRLRSADVIHSFWFPRLGGKRDVNPVPAVREGEAMKENYLTFTINEPGVYDGQCAEYCGTSHAIMRMRVIAQEPAEFERWAAVSAAEGFVRETTEGEEFTAAQEALRALRSGEGAPTQAGQTPTQPVTEPVPGQATAGRPQPDVAVEPGPQAQAPGLPGQTPQAAAPPTGADAALIEQGRQLFTTRACIACHTVEGTTARGVLGPNLTNFGDRWSIGAGAADNTQENVEQWIRAPQSLKAAALMPGAREEAAGMPPTGLDDDEIRAIATYLRSLTAGR